MVEAKVAFPGNCFFPGGFAVEKEIFCFIVSAHPPSGALQLLKAFEKQEEKLSR